MKYTLKIASTIVQGELSNNQTPVITQLAEKYDLPISADFSVGNVYLISDYEKVADIQELMGEHLCEINVKINKPVYDDINNGPTYEWRSKFHEYMSKLITKYQSPTTC